MIPKFKVGDMVTYSDGTETHSGKIMGISGISEHSSFWSDKTATWRAVKYFDNEPAIKYHIGDVWMPEGILTKFEDKEKGMSENTIKVGDTVIYNAKLATVRTRYMYDDAIAIDVDGQLRLSTEKELVRVDDGGKIGYFYLFDELQCGIINGTVDGYTTIKTEPDKRDFFVPTPNVFLTYKEAQDAKAAREAMAEKKLAFGRTVYFILDDAVYSGNLRDLGNTSHGVEAHIDSTDYDAPGVIVGIEKVFNTIREAITSVMETKLKSRGFSIGDIVYYIHNDSICRGAIDSLEGSIDDIKVCMKLDGGRITSRDLDNIWTNAYKASDELLIRRKKAWYENRFVQAYEEGKLEIEGTDSGILAVIPSEEFKRIIVVFQDDTVRKFFDLHGVCQGFDWKLKIKEDKTVFYITEDHIHKSKVYKCDGVEYVKMSEGRIPYNSVKDLMYDSWDAAHKALTWYTNPYVKAFKVDSLYCDERGLKVVDITPASDYSMILVTFENGDRDRYWLGGGNGAGMSLTTVKPKEHSILDFAKAFVEGTLFVDELRVLDGSFAMQRTGVIELSTPHGYWELDKSKYRKLKIRD